MVDDEWQLVSTENGRSLYRHKFLPLEKLHVTYMRQDEWTRYRSIGEDEFRHISPHDAKRAAERKRP